jgi:hypothetical protein
MMPYKPSFRRGSLSALLVGLSFFLASTPLSLAQTPTPVPGPPEKSAPDVIIFVNGDQLTGKFERGVGDSIVFSSDMTGEITVPLSKVKELRSSANFAVLRKGVPLTKLKVVPSPISVQDGKIIVTPSNAPVETIASGDLNYIIDSVTYNRELNGHHKFTDGWSGALTGGVTLIQGTQFGNTFAAGVAVTRVVPTVSWLPPRDRTIIGFIQTYGKLTQPVIPQTVPPSPDLVVKTNILHAAFEQDRFVSPRFFILGTAVFDHNFAQGLQLSQLYGVGVGWTIIQNARHEFDVTANVHYQRQAFQTSVSNQDLIGMTLGEHYLLNLPHKIVFTESGQYLPAFNNTNAWSANFLFGLALPVYHRFSFNINGTNNYINNPPPGFQANSFQFITGITYNLH